MPTLSLTAGFPFPMLVTDVSANDTMFDGSTDHYLSVGLSALRAIEEAVRNGPRIRRVLDLPCGHGRVTRLLRARYPDASITTSDIDADGVAFTADRFGAKGVATSGDFRQLDLGGPFDLVWVGSLLTHLSQLNARRMLDCLARHMAPGAVLVVSSHGEYVAERLRSWDYGLGAGNAKIVLDQYERTGYGYRDYPGGTGYGISLIRRSWLERALAGSPLRLDAYIPRGWDNHQDVVVLRLEPPAGAELGLLGRLAAATASRRAPAAWFESRYVASAPFDEAHYLQAYPDVADAVQDGRISSGYAHWLEWGREEGRSPPPGYAGGAAD